MTLLAAAEAYVVLRRALGAVFSVDARILRSFCRSLGDIPVVAISSELCLSFCRGSGAPTRFWLRKHEALRGFFRYLVGRGHLEASPLLEPPPASGQPFSPTSTRRTSSDACSLPPLRASAVVPA